MVMVVVVVVAAAAATAAAADNERDQQKGETQPNELIPTFRKQRGIEASNLSVSSQIIYSRSSGVRIELADRLSIDSRTNKQKRNEQATSTQTRRAGLVRVTFCELREMRRRCGSST